MRGALPLSVLAFSTACAPGEPRSPPPAKPSTADFAATGYAGGDPQADEVLRGVTMHDPTRCGALLVLYTDERSRCLARDRSGALVAERAVPGHDQVEAFEPLADGGLVALSADQGLTRLDATGALVWQVAAPAHHELAPARDGGFWVALHEERPWKGRRVRFDQVAKLTPDGALDVVWSSFDARAELARHHAPTPLSEPADETSNTIYDVHHLNSIQELPDTPLGRSDPRFRAGNLLLCLRNVSLLVVVDPARGDVTWAFGPGELDFPHMPRLLASGTLLVFDNGWHRGWSRVLELDPLSGRSIWSYSAPGFFTKTRGSCQRLANGNTLICESERGRIFEVTPDGALAWEFWNPTFDGPARRRIYRALGRTEALGLRAR
jgi:hypothetical protein